MRTTLDTWYFREMSKEEFISFLRENGKLIKGKYKIELTPENYAHLNGYIDAIGGAEVAFNYVYKEGGRSCGYERSVVKEDSKDEIGVSVVFCRKYGYVTIEE